MWIKGISAVNRFSGPLLPVDGIAAAVETMIFSQRVRGGTKV
jgi:hypothetical protein